MFWMHILCVPFTHLCAPALIINKKRDSVLVSSNENAINFPAYDYNLLTLELISSRGDSTAESKIHKRKIEIQIFSPL